MNLYMIQSKFKTEDLYFQKLKSVKRLLNKLKEK